MADERKRILLIEDNLDDAVITVLLLRDMGHEIESALNSGAGLAAARTFRPDIVLLDVALPDGLGWDTAQQLKEELPAARIFTVTGRAMDADRERSRLAGCEGHLVKPVGIEVYESLLGDAIPTRNLRDAFRRELRRHELRSAVD